MRDRHIDDISVRGRMGWQRASGYNQRSRAETLMSRWKTVIGPKLMARSFKDQKTEAKIGVRILNRMTELGRPNFERTALNPSRVGRVPTYSCSMQQRRCAASR